MNVVQREKSGLHLKAFKQQNGFWQRDVFVVFVRQPTIDVYLTMRPTGLVPRLLQGSKVTPQSVLGHSET